MSDTLFGEWLERKMRDAGMSDTKLAAQLGLTAPAIAKWRTGVNDPHDRKYLEGISKALNVPRHEVFKMAGVWIPGLEHEGLSPDMAQLAYTIQMQLQAVEGEDARELARAALLTQIHAWKETLEILDQFVKSQSGQARQEQGESHETN